MTDQVNAYSDSFLEASRLEADRLSVEAQRLRAAASEHIVAAEHLSAEALAIEQQVRELDEMLGRAPQLRLDLDADGLRGQKLRAIAIQVLARRRGLRQPIHYRDWYQMVREEAGQDVEAKDPLATFLVQISRSPLVAKAEDQPGVYLLDPDRAGRRAHETLQEAEAALRRAEADYTDARRQQVGDGDPASIESRRRLDTGRRRLNQAQRELAEIARSQTELQELVGG
jgi:hypothetical protein